MTKETRRDFTLTWTLDAPRADVFRAWTDPDHLQWFYNPAQPTSTEPIELDLRVGGVWRQRMVISDSTEYVTGGFTARSSRTRGSYSPGARPTAGPSSTRSGSTRARSSPLR
jgi:uncharacterized protein YndB with AHSA1/START domain